jgi:hypothetical protein
MRFDQVPLMPTLFRAKVKRKVLGCAWFDLLPTFADLTDNPIASASLSSLSHCASVATFLVPRATTTVDWRA